MKRKIKLGSVGSRDFLDRLCVYAMLELIYNIFDVEVLISGGALGADTLSVDFAKFNQYEFTEFLADWETYGYHAGKIRNGYIVDNSDIIVAFWDCKSGGTANTIEQAIYHKKQYIVVQPISSISKGIKKFNNKDVLVFLENGKKYEFHKGVKLIDVENGLVILKNEHTYKKYKNLYLIHYNSK